MTFSAVPPLDTSIRPPELTVVEFVMPPPDTSIEPPETVVEFAVPPLDTHI